MTERYHVRIEPQVLVQVQYNPRNMEILGELIKKDGFKYALRLSDTRGDNFPAYGFTLYALEALHYIRAPLYATPCTIERRDNKGSVAIWPTHDPAIIEYLIAQRDRMSSRIGQMKIPASR